MGCSNCILSTVKCLMIVFNIIFALAGVALLTIGILFLTNSTKIPPVINNSEIKSFPILAICIGVCMFTFAFFGCCGAIWGNHCLLLTYSIILLLLFVLQLALGIFAFMQIKDKHKFRNDITKELTKLLKSAKANDMSAQQAFNLLQSSLKCCGVSSSSNWSPNNIPGNCCGKLDRCGNSDKIYKVGCADKLSDILYNNIEMIGIVAFALAGIELLTAIYALYLRKRIPLD